MLLLYSKESQGTQVNFTVLQANDNNIIYEKEEQKNKCDCYSLTSTKTKNEISKITDETQSPLIIISVYPKQHSTEIIKTVSCYKEGNASAAVTSRSKSPRASPERTRANSPKKEIGIRQIKTVYRDHSPSPVAKNIYRKKEESIKNQEDKNVFGTTKRRVNPSNQPTQTSHNTRKADRKSTDKNRQNGTRNGAINQRAPLEFNRNPHRSMEKRTEQMILKQVLVNDFTNKLTESMDTKKPACNLNAIKNGTSKVTVNINNENDYYNVMFQQDKLTTDLSIRRKKNLSPKRNNDQLDRKRSPPPISERKSNGKRTGNINETVRLDLNICKI